MYYNVQVLSITYLLLAVVAVMVGVRLLLNTNKSLLSNCVHDYQLYNKLKFMKTINQRANIGAISSDIIGISGDSIDFSIFFKNN